MTSRCPDVDKEEVYISALTSKSRTEMFRELEALHHEQESREQESNEHYHLNRLRLDEVVNGDLTCDINNTFVHGQCSGYQGVLFKEPRPKLAAKRRRQPSSTLTSGVNAPPSSSSTNTGTNSATVTIPPKDSA